MVLATPGNIAQLSGATVYQPAPVIMGEPDLPMLSVRGVTANRNATWTEKFNYQGVQAKLVVLKSNGTVHELNNQAYRLRPNEKLRFA